MHDSHSDHHEHTHQDTQHSQPVKLTGEGDNTELTISLPWSQIEPAFNSVLKKLAQRVKLAGFRKGKVPHQIAEEHLDEAQIVSGVLEKIADGAFRDALSASKKTYDIVGQPRVSPEQVGRGVDWKIRVEFAERPTIVLDGYKPKVRQALEELTSSSKANTAEGKHSKSKSTQIESPTPEQTPSANSVPSDNQKLAAALAALRAHSAVSIPTLLIDRQADSALYRLIQTLKQLRIEIDQYLASRKMSGPELISELRTQALVELQNAFIIDELSKIESIKVEESDRQAYVDTLKDERLKSFLQANPQRLTDLDDEIRRQKTIKLLQSV